MQMMHYQREMFIRLRVQVSEIPSFVIASQRTRRKYRILLGFRHA